jgi:hypothetical protein
MKTIRLELSDEQFAELKLCKEVYEASIKAAAKAKPKAPEKPVVTEASKKHIAWHDITVAQLKAQRPDLLRAISGAKDSWASAGYEVVKAIEADRSVVRLKGKMAVDKLILRKPLNPNAFLVFVMELLVGVALVVLIARALRWF